MLKFYYHPLSPIARRVWLALLEKEIAFEPVFVDLKNRENLKRDYLALNPFHHVPRLWMAIYGFWNPLQFWII